jgi:hypothetical protein
MLLAMWLELSECAAALKTCSTELYKFRGQHQRALGTHNFTSLLLGCVSDHMSNEEGVVIVVCKRCLDISSSECVQCHSIALFLECFSYCAA